MSERLPEEFPDSIVPPFPPVDEDEDDDEVQEPENKEPEQLQLNFDVCTTDSLSENFTEKTAVLGETRRPACAMV